ncbi:MAG TPA: hypothetical protein VM286_03445 [Candidatus Thermoplasmatota archaeon]|nr:hypothetical protein [Candidatus Thermoplasmatota archaeon]
MATTPPRTSASTTTATTTRPATTTTTTVRPARDPARMWMMVLGWVLVLTAILGLIQPVVDIMHKMYFHIESGEMVLHWILAAVTLGLAYGLKDNRVLATLVIAYGAVYLLVGILGFFMGKPDSPVAGWHVDIGDNILHIVLGLVTLGAGMASRKADVVDGPAVRTV